MEFHPHEVKILKALDKTLTASELAKKSGLQQDAVLRACSWLSTKNLVAVSERLTKEISLDKEGKSYAERGLPERQIASAVGKSAPFDEIRKTFQPAAFTVGLGWLKKKRMASFEGGVITITDKTEGDDERLLRLLAEKGTLSLDDVDEKTLNGFEMLKTRQSVIKVAERRAISYTPTSEGMKLAGSLEEKETVSQLTPALILSGGWRKTELRPYDPSVYVRPTYPAKQHPLQGEMAEIRDIFIRMGFSEIEGPLVTSSFWNFDALFTAQDHPAREMQDTFYLKTPEKVGIPDYGRLKNIVKETHENGWTTGSTGWQYSWDERQAEKPVLRTHTTSATARHLSTLKKEELPAKVFCIGKVFRNEAVDYKHLPEFYQVEGIIVDENANFRNLLGVLKRFYDEMGFNVRFR
ncbi:MAG: phenylalanine--tRNA ligase subunit alpha, partial [Candidatus Altiarchaeota archaeon]|nr:phenylalanine--tRNA ligase subunit alpha [Candidatus Altiarchaeota archaeon]